MFATEQNTDKEKKMFEDIISSLPGLVVMIVIFVLAASKSKNKKYKNGNRQEKTDAKAITAKKVREETKNLSGKIHGKEHTHDKLDFDCYNPAESEDEHYKKQLDGFLQAGIIEKAEYRELWRKYTERKKII